MWDDLLSALMPVDAAVYPRTKPEKDAGIAEYRTGNTSGDITAPNYIPGDVRRYGAAGDGVTEDTLAIQAALEGFQPAGPFTRVGLSSHYGARAGVQ